MADERSGPVLPGAMLATGRGAPRAQVLRHKLGHSGHDWDRADIAAALKKLPGRPSLRAFSRQHGLSATSTEVALRRPWPRVERLIADALGLEPWDLWPSRYTRAHQPRRGRHTPSADDTIALPAPHPFDGDALDLVQALAGAAA